MKYILIWLVIISIFSAVITVYDKVAAKAKFRRIPEKTLILSGLIGGATAMFLTMLIIRHKTRHNKFMLVLPAIIVLHIVIMTAIASLF